MRLAFYLNMVSCNLKFVIALLAYNATGWNLVYTLETKENLQLQCIYINLDNASERRAQIEDEFKQHNNRGWKLRRLSAVSSSAVKPDHEFLTTPEIACFISHTQAISIATEYDGHVMILEDDASFSARTFDRIDTFLEHLSRDRPWDIVFTQVGTFESTIMTFLSSIRARLIADQSACHDMKSLFPHVWGAASYIINSNSKQKVLDIFRHRDRTIPFDIHLMKLIFDGKLNGYLSIPFATSLNLTSVDSQLRNTTPKCQYIDYVFRKLMSLDCDDEVKLNLNKYIEANFDFVRSPFLFVLGSFLSDEINAERQELTKQKPMIMRYLMQKDKEAFDERSFVSEHDMSVP